MSLLLDRGTYDEIARWQRADRKPAKPNADAHHRLTRIGRGVGG